MIKTSTAIILGLVGILAVGAALVAYIRGTATLDDPGDLKLVAWGLAFVGSFCIGTSVYALLKRLGAGGD